MTRILIPRGSSGSSSNSPNQGRSGSLSARPEPVSQAPSPGKDEECGEEVIVGDELLEDGGTSGRGKTKSDEALMEGLGVEQIGDTPSGDEVANDSEKGVKEEVVVAPQELVRGPVLEFEGSSGDSCVGAGSGSSPPPPPVPPPKPSANNTNSRRNNVSGNSNAVPGGSPRRGVVWHGVSARTSPAGSLPSSPRAHGESEGYNSADEQNSCLVSSYDDVEKERQFEIDIRRAKGYEVKRMLDDGNCLFRAIADQVYGDSELYDLVRQMCIDYMEHERDHYSQFITEGFTSYCKRKRRDKVYGNNVEIQAVCEIYNRPIHIYSYSTEPINIFQRNYNTDTSPIRLSYHHGNHYNSLVDPRRPTIGVGLGFSSLRGRNVDKDQVKDAIKAQQDQQIDNARLYSDLEMTEKEIELAVMEASRAEYLAGGTFKQQHGLRRESSTSNAEPSSSGATSGSDRKKEQGKENETGLSSSSSSIIIQILLSMGFSYLQAVEAYSIFGDDVDVDSMVYYLLETSSGTSSNRKGKAAESSHLHK